MLEYAVAQLLPHGSTRDAIGCVLERIAADLGAQAALVVAPASKLPLGEEAAYPAEIRNDLVLLAQVRSAWASHGTHATASGHAFQVDLETGRRRLGLLVVPAEPAEEQLPCALALVGDTSRWKAGARSTLKALATVVAVLLRQDTAPAADARRPPARAAADPAAPADRSAHGERAAHTERTARAVRPARSALRRPPADLSPARSDALARALVAGGPSAVVAVDSGRRIREFNPAAEELFGRSRSSTLGLDMPETLVPEQYRQRFIDAMAGYLATGDSRGLRQPVRLRALRADGTERPVDLTPMPVTVAGETYFFGFLRDATDLETATTAVAEGDARFALLSDIAPVGIMQSDVDGTCRFVNDKWCEMAGIPAAEVIGRNWRTTINPRDVEKIDAMRNEDAATEELATDCRLLTAAGGEVWVHAVVRRVVDGSGNLIGRVTALTDVDHRRRDEAEQEKDRRRLSEQNLELMDLNEARLRYLSTVSHELRTPLTSVVSFAELIRSESSGLTPDAVEYLDIIQRNAERLLGVVGNLLDLSSLEEGVAQLDLQPVSVPFVTRESVRTGWGIAAVDGIRLDLSAQDGPEVRADGGRLQQVLDNLISNAVKFTAAGGRVEVRATHDSREWRIDVADWGIGIPPGEVGQLFDRFFRASNARQAAVPGSGLGLPTAKAITELLGGRIEVTSAVGSGTTFTVYLPIRR
ncbi:MAG TPA: PAS domain-containing sensor histidine kinase [Streptosporangiaceae bacterium]|nr:PAS domain-containing sensor histidine kinase [Streptosporangiaceae bacterium]